ncbi:MAG: hypothetical protein ACMXYC_04940 [Candidatus Woesearchaeota archaeon]
MLRAQTTTEYLVITAVVIIIAVVVVGVLGGIPGIGGGTSANVNRAQLQTLPVGIIDYHVGQDDTVVILRNNQQQNIVVTQVVYGSQTCAVNRQITPGRQIRIDCDNINSSLPPSDVVIEYRVQEATYYVSTSGSASVPEVNLEWVSYDTGWFTFSNWQAIVAYTEWNNPGNAVVDDINFTTTVPLDGSLVVYLGTSNNSWSSLSDSKALTFGSSFGNETVGNLTDEWGEIWSIEQINDISVTLGVPTNSYYHQFYNATPALHIPSGVQINGIEVRVRGRTADAGFDQHTHDVQFIEARIHYSVLE